MNKLGIDNKQYIENIEIKLVEHKMNIISSNFTFNEEELKLEYIKKLHSFLFGDIYYNAGNFSNRINTKIIMMANKIIDDIYDMLEYINYDEVKEMIENKIKELIGLQLFDDGNNRVIMCYYNLLIEPYIKSSERGR
jgi:fido (protein-threonine AMPylation protein)